MLLNKISSFVCKVGTADQNLKQLKTVIFALVCSAHPKTGHELSCDAFKKAYSNTLHPLRQFHYGNLAVHQLMNTANDGSFSA